MELDGERPAGNGATHPFGKWHRRTALQRLHDGDAVLHPVVVGSLFQFIGDPSDGQESLPARLKLTITVISMGLARDAGGGFQQVFNFANTSRMVLTCAGSVCAQTDADGSSSAAANQRNR